MFSLFFLARNGLLFALSGAGIGSGTLAPKRQPLTVAEPPVAPDIHQALDVQGDFRAEPAFNLIVVLKDIPQHIELFLRKIIDHPDRIDLGFDADCIGARPANTKNIGQSDINVFIREIYPHKPRHINLCPTRHPAARYNQT